MTKQTWILAAALLLAPAAASAQATASGKTAASAQGAAATQGAATQGAASTQAAAAAKPPASVQAAAAFDSQARIDAALHKAADAKVPVALLERKVAEGKAKGVPLERIAAAVEGRVDVLIRAREAMTSAKLQGVTEGDLSVGADAVQAGVSDAALIEVSRAAPPDRRAVAIAVLTDLVVIGHTSDRALVQVQGALRRGPDALANLRAEAASQLQVGGAAGAAGAGVQVDGGAGVRVELGGGVRR